MDPAVTLRVAVLALTGTLVAAALGVAGTLLAQLPQTRRENKRLEFERQKERTRSQRDDYFRYAEYKRETYAELVGQLQRWRRDIVRFHLYSEQEPKPGSSTSLRAWISGVADDLQPMGDERHQVDLLLGRIQLMSSHVHDSAYWAVARFEWLTLALADVRPRSFIAEMVDGNDRQNIQLIGNKIGELVSAMRQDLVIFASSKDGTSPTSG